MRTWFRLSVAAVAAATVGAWGRLPDLPERQGLAGAYTGVSGGALLVGGGANFPGRKPWEGGTKVWYDRVFVLERPGGAWRDVGRLPRPLGYGVSVTYRGSVICAGGSDAERHYRDAFRLEWSGGRLRTTPLPPLPRPVANACGALAGSTLYVLGGQETPASEQALNSVFGIDLAKPRAEWRSVTDLPGPARILATAAAVKGALYVVGGAELVTVNGKTGRRYLRDAYRYRPASGWERLPDLSHPAVAAPTPAPVLGDGFVVLGGDDGSQVGTAPERHPGFRREMLFFQPGLEEWSEVGSLPAPRVATGCVLWNGRWVIAGGEVRPGIRSPEVWAWDPGGGRAPAGD